MLMNGRGEGEQKCQREVGGEKAREGQKGISVLVPSINSPYIPANRGEFSTLFQPNNQMVSTDQQTWFTPRGSGHVQVGSDDFKGQAQRCVFDLSY